MYRFHAVAVAVVTCMAAVAGCIGDGRELPADASLLGPGAEPCLHPWPCMDGTEWPIGLEGPFDLLGVQEHEVASHDGTVLRGWVALPDLPDGVKAPVVFVSSPYMSTCYVGIGTVFCQGTPADPAWWMDPPGETGYPPVQEANLQFGFPPIRLVNEGYAVAIFSVRGTGASGGCFTHTGLDEQRDQAFLVDWLAQQSWSNGRVAMTGLSYEGTTPWQSAVQAPPALKTIVPLGIIVDHYLLVATPQGAWGAVSTANSALYQASLAQVPPLGGDAMDFADQYPQSAPERTCEEQAALDAEIVIGQSGHDRTAAIWNDRRLHDRLGNVSAATFVVQGFLDYSGHAFQEDTVWDALPAATPKRMILGQWGHTIPSKGQLDGVPGTDDWQQVLTEWFDFWLKGTDAPARVGTVNFQSDVGNWHTSASWPPIEARSEVLYLTEAGLRPDAAPGSRSFQGLATGPIELRPCHDPDRPDILVYSLGPLDGPVTIAGNAWAYLRLESNLPGGIVSVHLAKTSPGQDCDGIDEIPTALAEYQDMFGVDFGFPSGAADLRFKDGNFIGKDFPTGAPHPVRIDLMNGANHIEAGETLHVIVQGAWQRKAEASTYAPSYVVHGGDGGSHIVLPLIEGTLGGQAPTVDYPPRPFTRPS